MPQLTIPQQVAALLPLFATLISGFFSHDRLPRWANALIALIALVATAVVCLWLAGNFTGNAQASVLAVLGYVAILMNGDLRAIYTFLVTVPSPLAALATPQTAAASLVPASASSRSQVGPQPIQFPTAASQSQSQTTPGTLSGGPPTTGG